MSVSFKNMKASIGSQSYYAESINISESIDVDSFAALGTKNYNTIARGHPEGSIDIDFYVTTGDEIDMIESGYGSTGFTEVRAGPFIIKNALLNSFSINGSPSDIIRGSISYSYYGQMESGSSPSKSGATIIPAHGASSSGRMEDLGVSKMISFDYSFSQNFDVKYSLASSGISRVSYAGGSKTLDIESVLSDVDFEKTNLTGASGLCISESGFSKRASEIGLYNLCQEHVADLSISGILNSRSLSSSPGSEVIERINISEKYVKNTGCDE